MCTGQTADIGVTAGSTSGALVALLIIIVAISIAMFVWLRKCKRQKFNLSTNVAYCRRYAQDKPSHSNNNYEVVTEQNVVYELSKALEVPELDRYYNAGTGKTDFTLGI